MTTLPKSIVLYGPQGTRKTLHARRLADHFGLKHVLEVDDCKSQSRRLFPWTNTLVVTNKEPSVSLRRRLHISQALALLDGPAGYPDFDNLPPIAPAAVSVAPEPARRDTLGIPLDWVVWIDDNMGYGPANWEINNPGANPEQSLEDALAHARQTIAGGYPTAVLPRGHTPATGYTRIAQEA